MKKTFFRNRKSAPSKKSGFYLKKSPVNFFFTRNPFSRGCTPKNSQNHKNRHNFANIKDKYIIFTLKWCGTTFLKRIRTVSTVKKLKKKSYYQKTIFYPIFNNFTVNFFKFNNQFWILSFLHKTYLILTIFFSLIIYQCCKHNY